MTRFHTWWSEPLILDNEVTTIIPPGRLIAVVQKIGPCRDEAVKALMESGWFRLTARRRIMMNVHISCVLEENIGIDEGSPFLTSLLKRFEGFSITIDEEADATVYFTSPTGWRSDPPEAVRKIEWRLGLVYVEEAKAEA